MWVKNTVEGMELENASEEDFKSQRVSINIPFIGKFYSSFKKVQKAQKQEEIINERIKNKERGSTT